MLKKVTALLLSLVMVLSLCSCGIKEKVGEKIGEQVVESALEKATGEELELDMDEEGATIKGSDGEFSFGNTDWPEGGAIEVIPAFKKGTITSAVNSETVSLITVEEVEENDFKEYVEELKFKGFINNVTQHSGELGLGYYANSDENTKASVVYYPEEKIMNISVEINTESTGEN